VGKAACFAASASFCLVSYYLERIALFGVIVCKLLFGFLILEDSSFLSRGIMNCMYDKLNKNKDSGFAELRF
jgi:hypothetical protein